MLKEHTYIVGLCRKMNLLRAHCLLRKYDDYAVEHIQPNRLNVFAG